MTIRQFKLYRSSPCLTRQDIVYLEKGRGVGTLLVRVCVLGDEAHENRNGRRTTDEILDVRRNDRIIAADWTAPQT